jgi:Phytanoyl-CoA dioxygenase (PhyH)
VDKCSFRKKLEDDGYAIFEEALPFYLVRKLRADCIKWVDICKEYQIKNKINLKGDGTAHHSIGGGDSIDEFIAMHIFHEFLADFFDEKPYILHACNPVGGFPNSEIYTHKIHRDVATFIPNYNLRINMLVMLDDFTLENGATRVYPGSHLCDKQPDEKNFDDNSISILGKAGDLVLFNSYLWHKGCLNHTTQNRVALTLSFGPAFIKPQMDYARLLGKDYGKQLSDLSRQILGYNARVPISLDEWYKPKLERLYWENQG